MTLLYLLLLPGPRGHHYYETAQLAAFAVYVALLLGQGYRRGYPARAWLPLVAAATLALVLGCQLVLLPPGQWLGWLRGDAAAVQALADGPRSIVGGATASFLAVLALRRALGFRGWAVFDAFAGPLCWALAVQSVGCVLAGCCWGEAISPGAWLSFTYGPGTPAYAAQLALGLVPAGAAHTLPLVPTQLLQLLLCAGTGLVLHVVRNRAAAGPGGSRYLLALGLLCLGRFAVEFWRDPVSEPLLATPMAVGGIALPGMQWWLLLEAVGQLGLLAWWIRRPATTEPTPIPHPAAPALVGLGLLVVTARLAPATLSLPEVVVLQALLLLVLLAEGHTWLVTLGRGVPRLAGLPLSLLLGGALLLATAQAPAPQRRDSTTSHSVLVSGGLLGNYHDGELQVYHGGGSCNGSGGGSYTDYYYLYHRVLAGGADVASLKTLPDGHQREFGGGLWVGELRTGRHLLGLAPGPFVVHPDTVLRTTLFNMHFFYGQRMGRDWLTLRYRIGIHMGMLGQYAYFQDSGFSSGTQSDTHFAPEVMLALGNPRLLFAQYDGGYGAENALGAYTTRFAVGSGLGQLNGSQLVVGYANSTHYSSPDMAFASANLRLPARTGLSSLSLEPYFATDFDRHNIFSMKLNYQLGGK